MRFRKPFTLYGDRFQTSQMLACLCYCLGVYNTTSSPSQCTFSFPTTPVASGCCIFWCATSDGRYATFPFLKIVSRGFITPYAWIRCRSNLFIPLQGNVSCIRHRSVIKADLALLTNLSPSTSVYLYSAHCIMLLKQLYAMLLL